MLFKRGVSNLEESYGLLSFIESTKDPMFNCFFGAYGFEIFAKSIPTFNFTMLFVYPSLEAAKRMFTYFSVRSSTAYLR